MDGAGELQAALGGATIRWIALLPIASALIHGILIGILRARVSDRLVYGVSLSALLGAFVLCILGVLELVGEAAEERLLDTVGPWIGGGVGPRSFSAELTFQLDPLSAVFSLLVLFSALLVYAHAIGTFVTPVGASGRGAPEPAGDGPHRTFAMLDLLVGSMLLLVLADNLLLFFLGWATLGIASQLFAAFAFDDPEASRAGAKTFVIGRVGDLGLLAAMLLLFDGLSRAGAPSLTFRGIEAAFRLLEGQGILWLPFGGAEAPLLLEIVGMGLVLAALTKCAQAPLHFWLPSSSEGPAVAASLIQSTTTVAAGVYVLLRFAFLLESAPFALRALIVAGATTLVLASLAAANQWKLTHLVAYTTSGLLGLVILGIGLGAYSAATYLLLTHAFAKAMFALTVGVVVDAQRGESDLRRMGGLAQRMPWTRWIFAVAGCALVGQFPLANYFPIEELIAFLWVSAHPASGPLIVAVFASVGLLAYAVARAFFLIFYGNVRPGGLVQLPLRDPTGWQQQSLTALAVMATFAGMLSPAQFWQGVTGAPSDRMDTIGHFLSRVIPGLPDPELGGAERGWLTVLLGLVVLLGFVVAWGRLARQGYRGEPKRPFVRVATTWMREMFYFEQAYRVVLVRPLRRLADLALVRGIEGQLIDRVVVSGGSGFVRGSIWSLLRRVQNGRLQSYTLIGLLTVLVLVTWIVT